MGISRNQNDRSARAANYLRELARMRVKFKEFISFGSMKKPLELQGNIPTITFSTVVTDSGGDVSIPAIQTSTWSDGESILVTFVNGKVPKNLNESITFSFDFDSNIYGINQAISIKEVTETTEGAYEAIENQFTKELTLDSYDVRAFVITPTALL